MVTKLDVLENILNNKFDLTPTQAFKKWQTGITQVDQVSIDNSGDFVRGIITLPTSISKGMGYKEFTHDIVIECNSEEVLDKAVEELEAYSFDAKNGYDPIVLSDLKTEYTSTNFKSCYKTIHVLSEEEVVYIEGFTTYGYFASVNGGYGVLNIPINQYIHSIYLKLYTLSSTTSTCNYYYKTASEVFSANGSGTLAYFNGLVNTFITNAEGSGSFNFQNLTPSYGYNELWFSFTPLKTDTYLQIIFKPTYDVNRRVGYDVTTGLSVYNLYSPSDIISEEYLTNYISNLPYYIEIIEKDRSQASDNSYQAQLQLKARYER